MVDAQLTWIGTATTLLNLGPFTILTDPNFLHQGQYAYLGYGLVSKRLTEPSLEVSALPPLDAVVLSHRHGDHWDRVAKTGLRKDTPVVTTTHAAAHLRGKDRFQHTVGLKTWQSHQLEAGGHTLTVTSLPGVHSTNPVLHALLPPVMGSLLELADPEGRVVHRAYLTGDTMLCDGIDEVSRRYPDIDVAVLHLGKTKLPGGFVVTMSGADGAELLRRVTARVAVPIHYGDYGVFSEGVEPFVDTMSGAGLPVDVRVVERGGTVPLT